MSDELAGLCYNIETLSIDKLEVSTNIWNSKVFGWHIRNALIAIRDHGQINKLCNINIYTLCRIANDTLCVNSHSLSNILLNNEMGSQIPRLMYALEKKWTQKFLWIGSGFLVGSFWLHKSSIEKAIRSFFLKGNLIVSLNVTKSLFQSKISVSKCVFTFGYDTSNEMHNL